MFAGGSRADERGRSSSGLTRGWGMIAPGKVPACAGRRATMADDDTLARMFWARVERSGASPAQQFKQGGAWKTLAWREVGEIVREVALGLLALGRKKSEAVGVLSATRAEWVQADFAIFSAGCRTIP